MSLLKSLEHLLGGGQQQQHPQSHPAPGNLQAQQSASPVLGNNTYAAHAYNHAMATGNVNAPVVMHNDPANFGYPADNSGMRLQVNRFVNSGLPQDPNLGGSSMGIQGGGQINPGFTPMQGSRGLGTNPQMGAFSRPQLPQFNPQVRDNGFYYN